MSYFASPWVLLPPSWNECHFFKTNFSKLLFPNACLPTEVVKFIFTTHYISFFTCNPIMILATKVDYVPWPLISLVSTFSNFHEKLKTKTHLGWRDYIVRFLVGRVTSPLLLGNFLWSLLLLMWICCRWWNGGTNLPRRECQLRLYIPHPRLLLHQRWVTFIHVQHVARVAVSKVCFFLT